MAGLFYFIFEIHKPKDTHGRRTKQIQIYSADRDGAPAPAPAAERERDEQLRGQLRKVNAAAERRNGEN